MLRRKFSTKAERAAQLVGVGVVALALSACGGTTPNATLKSTTAPALSSAASTSAAPVTSAPGGEAPAVVTKTALTTVNVSKADLIGNWTSSPAQQDDASDSQTEAQINACTGTKVVKGLYDIQSPSFTAKVGQLPVTVSTEVERYRTAADLQSDEKSTLTAKAISCGTSILNKQLDGTSDSDAPGVTIGNVKLITFPGRNQGPSDEVGATRSILTVINAKKVPTKFVTDVVYLVKGLDTVDVEFQEFEAAPLSNEFEAELIAKVDSRLQRL